MDIFIFHFSEIILVILAFLTLSLVIIYSWKKATEKKRNIEAARQRYRQQELDAPFHKNLIEIARSMPAKPLNKSSQKKS